MKTKKLLKFLLYFLVWLVVIPILLVLVFYIILAWPMAADALGLHPMIGLLAEIVIVAVMAAMISVENEETH